MLLFRANIRKIGKESGRFLIIYLVSAVSKATNSAALVADNLLMALFFFVLIAIPTMNFFLKKFTHPHIDKLAAKSTGVESEETLSSKYWGATEISLQF